MPRRACQESHTGSKISQALGQFSSREEVKQLLGGELKTAPAAVHIVLGHCGGDYLQEHLKATVISQALRAFRKCRRK